MRGVNVYLRLIPRCVPGSLFHTWNGTHRIACHCNFRGEPDFEDCTKEWVKIRTKRSQKFLAIPSKWSSARRLPIQIRHPDVCYPGIRCKYRANHFRLNVSNSFSFILIPQILLFGKCVEKRNKTALCLPLPCILTYSHVSIICKMPRKYWLELDSTFNKIIDCC